MLATITTFQVNSKYLQATCDLKFYCLWNDYYAHTDLKFGILGDLESLFCVQNKNSRA